MGQREQKGRKAVNVLSDVLSDGKRRRLKKVAFHLMTATPQREKRRGSKAEGKGRAKNAKSELQRRGILLEGSGE